MKRKITLFLLAAGVAAISFAQGWGGNGNQNRLPPAETVTVSGSMIVAHGFPAVKSGDVTYLVSGLSRLLGFVDGLKEGAQVTIEGSAISIQRDGSLKFLRPSKITLSGKTYDLAMPGTNRGDFNPDTMMPRWNNPLPPRNFNRQPNPPQRQAPRQQRRNFL